MSSRCAPHTRRHLDRSATSPMRCFSDSGHTCAAPRLRSLMSLPARLCSHSACRGSTATELERVPPQPTGCAHYHACGAPVPEGASGRPAQESMDTRGAVPERQPRTPPMRPITTDLEYRRPHRGRGAAHPSTHARARARAHTHAKRGCATAHRDQTRMRDASPAPAQYS
jgi:hypothetical protein